jgi:hypothetical protein
VEQKQEPERHVSKRRRMQTVGVNGMVGVVPAQRLKKEKNGLL